MSARALAASARGFAPRVSASQARHVATRTLFWIGMYGAALVIFGVFVSTRGVDPLEMYRTMYESTFQGSYGPGQVLNRTAPFLLAGMAVAVPARAGLINIGGEGQIVIGATAAGGVALALGDHLAGLGGIAIMAGAAAAAGALWAGIAALLKLAGGVDEAISTLLLNYVGADVLSYLVYGPWKDASGTGQPVGKPLPAGDSLPALGFLNANIGIVLALAAAGLIALVLWRTKWGFALRCVGGNREAARRAGLSVTVLLLSAMLVGGALAGLAGMIQFSGAEGQLRPGIAATFGYTGFLASWLARHQPGKVILAALLLASLAVAGDSLQISSHLPGSVVNVLVAIVLLAVLSRRYVAARKVKAA